MWGDGPRPSWWWRRWSRGAGFSILLFSLIVFGVGLEAGLDGAAVLLGKERQGGHVTVVALCGMQIDGGPSTCDGWMRLTTRNGAMLANRTLQDPWGRIELDHAEVSTLHLDIVTSRGHWTRDIYVPDGDDAHVAVRVASTRWPAFGGNGTLVFTPDDTAAERAGLDPESMGGWEGAEPGWHAAGLLAAGLAVLGVVGGAMALAMTRYEWALGGTVAAVLACFLAIPIDPFFAVLAVVSLVHLFFIMAAKDQFRDRATFEASLLLE